jgi:cytidylate kinase
MEATPARPGSGKKRPVVVTVSAAFGAGGSHVAPDIARRLGLPFHDRAISQEVARRLSVPVETAIEHEQNPPVGMARLLVAMVTLGGALPGAAVPPTPEVTLDKAAYRREANAAIEGFARGGGVLLGRAGAIVLRDWPGALHVRLHGPVEARRAHAQLRESVEAQDAERAQRETDRAREAYVRHFYGCDATDAAHYHLVLDTTAIPLAVAVELIVTAVRARHDAVLGAPTSAPRGSGLPPPPRPRRSG